MKGWESFRIRPTHSIRTRIAGVALAVLAACGNRHTTDLEVVDGPGATNGEGGSGDVMGAAGRPARGGESGSDGDAGRPAGDAGSPAGDAGSPAGGAGQGGGSSEDGGSSGVSAGQGGALDSKDVCDVAPEGTFVRFAEEPCFSVVC